MYSHSLSHAQEENPLVQMKKTSENNGSTSTTLMHASPLAQTSDIRDYEIMRTKRKNTETRSHSLRTRENKLRRRRRKEGCTRSHSLTLSHAQREQTQKGKGSKRDSHSITHENKLRRGRRRRRRETRISLMHAPHKRT
jgi:hypothetical protein